MNRQLARLASRRLELLSQIAAQRMDLADVSRHFHKPLAVADTALRIAHLVFSRPAWFAGGAAALLLWRRKGVAGLAKGGWRLLRNYPSAILFGLKYLASDTRPAGNGFNTEISSKSD